MAIVRWEPLRDLMTTQREFDRLFREAFSPALGEGEVFNSDLGAARGHLREWRQPGVEG